MAYTKYSLTPSNNNAAPPDGAPEGMLPSAVNDTMRDMMAQIRDCGDGIRGGTYTMTAPVITGGSINGATIGATTASTGAFTTLAYSSTLTGGTGVVNLGSGQFYKDASGNVGIGTSSPGAKLDVNGAIQLRATTFTNSGNNSAILYENGFGSTYYGYQHRWLVDNSTGSEAMRITASGNVGIGTSSPLGKLQVKTQTNTNMLWQNSSYVSGGVMLNMINDAGNANVPLDIQASTMQFAISGTERMRIDSSGNLLVGTTSNLGSCTHTIFANAASYSLGIQQDSATGSGLRIAVGSINGTQQLIYGGSTSVNSFIVYSNGDVRNTNNSYGAISDVKLKENIVDATPKLGDLLKVKVRQYTLKSDETKTKQIGVVAQELEEVFAGMVDTSEDKDTDGNELGTQTKSVKYSVFVPMLIKAIQELKAIVDTQAARIAALESK